LCKVYMIVLILVCTTLSARVVYNACC